MSNTPQLHPSIVAMVSLAASIAAKHPEMGLCHLRRLRQYGIPEHQIDTVIEIARHIREEAAEKLDRVFDAQAAAEQLAAAAEAEAAGEGGCCSGKACC